MPIGPPPVSSHRVPLSVRKTAPLVAKTFQTVIDLERKTHQIGRAEGRRPGAAL